jgi:hypothetical protein
MSNNSIPKIVFNRLITLNCALPLHVKFIFDIFSFGLVNTKSHVDLYHELSHQVGAVLVDVIRRL